MKKRLTTWAALAAASVMLSGCYTVLQGPRMTSSIDDASFEDPYYSDQVYSDLTDGYPATETIPGRTMGTAMAILSQAPDTGAMVSVAPSPMGRVSARPIPTADTPPYTAPTDTGTIRIILVVAGVLTPLQAISW
jgi:hypothetical protein